MAGNMLTAGYTPKEALAGGALAGLATGMLQRPTGPGLKPSQLAVDSMRAAGSPIDYSLSPATAQAAGTEGAAGSGLRTLAQPALTQAGDLATRGITSAGAPAGEGLTVAPGTQLPAGAARPAAAGSPLKTLGQLAALSSLAGTRPPAAQQAIQQLSPQQQEYFNRPSVQWDWNRMQADANARNMSLSQFMSAYWPQVTSGVYNAQPPAAATPSASAPAPAEPPQGYAAGGYAAGGQAMGGLGAAARLMRGGGSGRDDTIPARLSDGEYVMDAETVALLGDGSTKAGAARLDEMRAQLRRHKGRALARGKFSPNAKSAAAYLKGA